MLHRFQSRKVFIYTYYRYTRKKVPELLPRITSTGKIKKLTTWNRIQIPFFPFCLLCTSMNVISLHNSSDMFGRKQIAHTKYTPIKSKEKNKQNSKTTSKKNFYFSCFLFQLWISSIILLLLVSGVGHEKCIGFCSGTAIYYCKNIEAKKR